MRRFLALLCFLTIGLTAASSAHAQAFADTTAFAPAKFGTNNPQLKAVLALQYQMQVLKRLIEREKAVNAMLQSAVAVGVNNPLIPKPDRELCGQVPANIPCAQAFKDLYKGFSVETKVADVPPPSANSASGSGGNIPPIASNDLSPLTGDTLDSSVPLYWTNVTCLQTKCSAVITPDPSDPRARYRVTTGEKLADGAVVSTISAAGVTLMNDTKPIVLNPAPKA